MPVGQGTSSCPLWQGVDAISRRISCRSAATFEAMMSIALTTELSLRSLDRSGIMFDLGVNRSHHEPKGALNMLVNLGSKGLVAICAKCNSARSEVSLSSFWCTSSLGWTPRHGSSLRRSSTLQCSHGAINFITSSVVASAVFLVVIFCEPLRLLQLERALPCQRSFRFFHTRSPT